MLLRVVAILTVLAWLHFLAFAIYGVIALYGQEPYFAVNLAVAVFCFIIICTAAYSAIHPRRALVVAVLLPSAIAAFMITRGLWLTLGLGTYERVSLNRTALAWIYGMLWFVPLPFMWAAVWRRLYRGSKRI